MIHRSQVERDPELPITQSTRARELRDAILAFRGDLLITRGTDLHEACVEALVLAAEYLGAVATELDRLDRQ